MNPIMTVTLGILITNDPFDLRIAVGAAIALLGVLVITLSREQIMKILSPRPR